MIDASYTRIVESRQLFVFDYVRRLIEADRARSLLDFGGGDGAFLADWLPETVACASYFDPSPEMREVSASRLGKAKRVSLYSTIDAIPNQSFDAVSFIAVWMCLRDEGEVSRALSAIHDKLSPTGRLYAVVTHPCFRSNDFTFFNTNFDRRDYFRNGFEFDVSLHDDHSTVVLRDTHWNLDAMSKQLFSNNMYIERLFELPDVNPEGAVDHSNGSPWLVLVARKQSSR